MRIYLDHNASTPVDPAVADAMMRVLQEDFGNPSSVHHFGQRAKAVLDEARSAVAAAIKAQASELVFTSGGTEANNLAVRGVAEALHSGRRTHLVASAIEHEAVLNTVKALGRKGWKTTFVPVERNGIVSHDALRAAVGPETALVSIMHGNNEIGTLQPIAELAAVAHEQGALFHTDAVQTLGKVEVDVRALGVDLLSLSAHKFNGPKGVGALWIRRGTRLTPVLTGGPHERNRRAGTENVVGIAGLGAAARLVPSKVEHDAPTLAGLRNRLESEILRTVPGTSVNGDPARRVPNTTNISFEGLEAESLLIALDLAGVAVSTGAACSSGTLEPSHVLRALGLSPSRVQGSIRFSLGLGSTPDHVDRVLDVLPATVAKLRRLVGAAARA